MGGVVGMVGSCPVLSIFLNEESLFLIWFGGVSGVEFCLFLGRFRFCVELPPLLEDI